MISEKTRGREEKVTKQPQPSEPALENDIKRINQICSLGPGTLSTMAVKMAAPATFL